MKPGDYRVQPIAVDGYADADGVYVSLRGDAWRCVVNPIDEDRHGDHRENASGYGVLPYSDEEGDYVPAPDGWESRVLETLVLY